MMLIFILLLLFFICRHIFFLTLSLTLSWTIARFLDPFCTLSPAHCRVTRDTFIFCLLTASATVLSGQYVPTGLFYLILLPSIFGTFSTFWYNLLLSRLYWEPAVTFVKVAGLHTDRRNTDPAHLFV